MNKFHFIFIVFLIPFFSCQKCNLKGDEILNERFDNYGEWLLYSEYDQDDQIYSRIENGSLKLKSNQSFQSCQRATYYFSQDLSGISGFQVCIDLKELSLPKKLDVHFYFSLGKYEMHATIEKKSVKNNLLILRMDDKGVSSNHKGAIFGGIGNEIENDNFSDNFIQISLCPEPEEDSEGDLYIEIENIKINTL